MKTQQKGFGLAISLILFAIIALIVATSTQPADLQENILVHTLNKKSVFQKKHIASQKRFSQIDSPTKKVSSKTFSDSTHGLTHFNTAFSTVSRNFFNRISIIKNDFTANINIASNSDQAMRITTLSQHKNTII
jgi:Tfp pilus assembly protein PilX